ncbi:MAG: response regulator transcription factor [Blastocatellia bacterium]|nr:response regulator transcription factor [Blastocatellia bacterium]MBN8723118.1 response regulator transcription factor [Acidobacteriota bacterium]
MKKKILLIEDEAGLVRTLTDRLVKEGYEVELARSGDVGLKKAIEKSFNLIILDIMLPQKNGLDICRDLRQRNILTPIIMLTAKGEIIDRVVGLKLGADDYLTKPFDMLELLARVEALIRRSNILISSSVDTYEFGLIQVDMRKSKVERQNKIVELSAKEFALLRYFIEHRELIISRNELLDAVWSYDAMVSTRTVDVHVSSLRQKLEVNPHHPQHIVTVYGLGYKFTG